MTTTLVIGAVILAVFAWAITTFVFSLLLRGFVPLIPSRPWVVEQILTEVNVPQKNPLMIALSSGRSGFFHALEKKYPQARLIGVEPSWTPFIIAKVQAYLRFTKIEVVHLPAHHVDFRQADFIYSHLTPDNMRGLGRKMKFECRPGTQIVSTGFKFPYLNAKKVIELPDRAGKLNWLAKNQKLFTRKSKQFKKEKRAYIYEI